MPISRRAFARARLPVRDSASLIRYRNNTTQKENTNV